MSLIARLRANRKAALAFIWITVFLDVVALGVVLPVLPKLILQFVGSEEFAGLWVGLFAALWGLMQFLCSPLLGVLSDRFGRRPVILGSNFGMAGDYALMALAPGLWLLAVGRLISGVTAASISTAFAYVADVTAPDKRAGAYGFLGAAFGLGFIAGPLLGGWLGEIDLRAPFWAAAGLSLVNALYGLVILPESLPKTRRARFRWRKADPLATLTFLRGRPQLFGLVGVFAASQFAHQALPTAFVVYALHRYGWGPLAVAKVFAFVGVAVALVQAGLVGRVVRRIGERNALMAGLICGATGFSIYGLAPTGALFLVGVPIMAFWGLAGPSSQALMTAMVRSDEQGRLQGANMSLSALVSVFAPLVFGGAIYYAIGPLASLGVPGAPFLLAAAILVVACGLAFVAARRAQAALAAAHADPESPRETQAERTAA